MHGVQDRRGGGMRIEADQDRCIGSGQCVMAASDVFDQREDDGIVIVLDPAPSAERQAAVREAVAACPSGALTVREG
jgi:ferredoxin